MYFFREISAEMKRNPECKGTPFPSRTKDPSGLVSARVPYYRSLVRDGKNVFFLVLQPATYLCLRHRRTPTGPTPRNVGVAGSEIPVIVYSSILRVQDEFANR